jgi:hypothetical protein
VTLKKLGEYLRSVNRQTPKPEYVILPHEMYLDAIAEASKYIISPEGSDKDTERLFGVPVRSGDVLLPEPVFQEVVTP